MFLFAALLIGCACLKRIEKQIWKTLLRLLILLKKIKPLRGKSWTVGGPGRRVYNIALVIIVITISLFLYCLTLNVYLFNLKFQILSLKPQFLPHKSRPGLTNSGFNLCSSTAKTRKEDRKVFNFLSHIPFTFNNLFATITMLTWLNTFFYVKIYVREPKAAPFVSMAEMMKKFQSSTREMSLPNLNNSFSHVND